MKKVKFRVISGAQTGVDRAALDVALKLKIPCGGYVPKGRFAEDGRVPAKYPVEECESVDYLERTKLNAKESDATLILNLGRMDGGTLFTYKYCVKIKKSVGVIDLDDDNRVEKFFAFLKKNKPGVLNIAGPRESRSPGIYRKAFRFLLKVFKAVTPKGKNKIFVDEIYDRFH